MNAPTTGTRQAFRVTRRPNSKSSSTEYSTRNSGEILVSSHVQFDPASFDPWKIQRVAHDLADHPLLQLDALVALGKRQESRRLVRTHSGDATAGSSFADAPKEHPNAKGAEATLAGIARANAWMSLLNVQADPEYRSFIDEVLDSVRPLVDPVDPGMCFRAGWIFVTSPRAVTPFHMDHEHNFILQIHGSKRLYVWDPADRAVLSEECLEEFHDSNSRRLVRWDESLRARAHVIDVAPGEGGYMPSTAPHMVENGDEPSVTMSFTYYTDATRRREMLYRANARLRAWGMVPVPPGRSAVRDGLKLALANTYFKPKTIVRRIMGKGVRDTGVRYAPV